MRPRYGCWWCVVAVLTGCTGPLMRSQSPGVETLTLPETRLVGDVARSYGLDYIQVETVALVTGLAGAGEDPPPSPQRTAVLTELQRHSVPNPEAVLASPDTAIVVARGFLRPGIRMGDTFDVEVRVPSRSGDVGIRGGWLLKNPMTRMAVLGGRIHHDHQLATVQGPILVDPDSSDEEAERGRILGGGRSLKSRDLGLVLKDGHRTFRISQQVGIAVNRRFHTYIRGVKRGTANPKTDEFVELTVHPRYRHNVGRYVQVVRNIAYRESGPERQERLRLLARQLADPVTTATAAVRLEAIGKDASGVLREGLESDDHEVRFHAAEALAYLDDSSAAETLRTTASQEPAFRARALLALASMEDFLAHDQLRQLLHVNSAETRYGAFRALQMANPADPFIQGERLDDQFHYHLVDTEGTAMIHVAKSKRPEIVLFGREQEFQLPLVADAGKHILITGRGLSSDGVKVSRFERGKPDEYRLVSRSVDDVIRAIVELGGSYPDVVQALQQAKQAGALQSRLSFDALPDETRTYRRTAPRTATKDRPKPSSEAAG